MKSFPQHHPAIVACLVLGIVFPLFLQLGGRGLNEPDEGRYAEIGREMLVSGDWMVPRLNSVPHYAKPPWIYWCVATSLKVFGIHEWSARLPSALAGLATALMVFVMGRRLGGTTAGLLSAMTLVSSGLFFTAARLITPDMMLTACITAALFCFWMWRDAGQRSWRWLLGMYAALGVGFLDKGPLALVVVFLTIVGFLLAQKRGREIRDLCLGRGLLLVAAIALPWFLFLCHRNPDLYSFYLVGEIKDRLVSGRGRWQSWYYHLCWLPLDCWPWTILAGCAAWTHWRRWRNNEDGASASVFLLAWFALPFAFYTLLSSKLPTYILPVLPPLSLMLGVWLAGILREPGGRAPLWSEWLTWLLLPAPAAGLYWHVQFRPQTGLTFMEKAMPIAGMAIAAIAASMIISVLVHRFARERRLLLSLGIWGAGSLAMLHAMVFQIEKIETNLRHNSSWRSLVRELDGIPLVGAPIRKDLHPDGAKTGFARPGPRVVMYEFYFRSCSFYLMRERDEVAPLYAGGSLWELHRDRNAEVKLLRSDLMALLKGAETVYVFTRPQYLVELRELTGLELPLVKAAGTGRYQIVLFSNRPFRK